MDQVKKRILWVLNDMEYMRRLHGELTEGVVGCLHNDYVMRDPVRGPSIFEGQSRSPMFWAVVRMLVSAVLQRTAESMVDMVLEAIEKEKTIK